jgi:hypothetical protein
MSAVKDVFETLRKVAEGYSLARYGDCEMRLVIGIPASHAVSSRKLVAELRAILRAPHERCLIGIWPKLCRPGLGKSQFNQFTNLLNPNTTYYSALVSRPWGDGPHITTLEYAELVQSLWTGKCVALIAHNHSLFPRMMKRTARKVTHIKCDSRDAYAQIDELYSRAIASKADIIIMAAGVTATCLANRFARVGQHGVNLGHLGDYPALYRWLK